MRNLAESAIWGAAVAASLMLGATAAAVLRLPERLAATLTAFGGGILLAAVALELVPEADVRAGPALTACALIAGTAVYVVADLRLTRDRSMHAHRRGAHAAAAGRTLPDAGTHTEAARGEAIAVGLFIDGVPESLALGLTIAEGQVGLALLVGILVGNVVEAYGAAHPIVQGGHTKSFAVWLLAGIGIALIAATILGATVLADPSDGVVGTAQAIASGAILAVTSISIIPYAFAEVSAWVAFAATAGFVVGYLLT